MGKVQQIVVENFKSYQGRVQIGPFRHFTCVVGPNGAGKSNLMDAISFVLGVQARVLRSEKLRDLVYRKEGEDPKKNQRTASVELVYEGTLEEGGDPLILVFKRLILKGGEARFQVNDETVSQADYHKRLESINILSKVRNFLVFQGDVEAVAQRQGKDLTAFFEQISGSEAFKQEYDRLASEKAKTEDNARYLFTKKRNAINEKKRVSHQKTEADEYRRLESDWRCLQREFYLFRLHGIARQQQEAEEARLRVEDERKVLETELRSSGQVIDAAERDRAQAHLATTQAERALGGAKAKLDRLNPERVAAQTRIAFIKQRLEDLQQHAQQDGRRREKLQEQVQALRAEQKKIEAEEKRLNESLAERKPHFTKSQREEFDRASAEVERITALNGDRARELEHQIKAVGAERSRAEHGEREATLLRDHLQKRHTELKEAEVTAGQAVKRDQQRADQCMKQLARIQAAVAEHSEEREQLLEERRQLLDTIQDITATERQLTRERELGQTCANLAAAVPGVHGRVLELCKPSQKRLHVAVNVAIGKFLDAIVVENGEVARQCVRYLKERMLPPMTFLPLANSDLRFSPADSRLEELVVDKSSLRLAINCVSFDERFARAFQFILSGVVVADTMADGRRLAFGDAQAIGLACKVVTVAGEAIAKNGNLSVNSEATREGATRFDLSELDSAKSRIEAIDRRLHGVHSSEASGTADVVALTEEAKKSESKTAEANTRLQWCQAQLAHKEQELREANAQLAALGPEAARLARDESNLKEEQRRLEDRISKGVASHFASLNAAMGVDDVRKLERDWRRQQEIGQARADELSRRFRNVSAELSMLEHTLQERSGGGERERPEELAPKLETELRDLSAKQESIVKESESLLQEMSSLEARVKDRLELERSCEKALTHARQESKEKKQQLLALEKRLGDIGAEARQMDDNRTDILRQSVLEDVEVPLLHGASEALQDIAEAPTQAVEGEAPADRAAKVAVDFSMLPEEKQAASGSGPAASMLEDEYRSELGRLRVELDRLSPNLKAIDQIHGVLEHVQAVSTEADAARREIEDVDAQFEAVRKARKDRFMNCFTKVAGEISAIYRRLTANTAGLHADGGSAYLDLEDMEDPFNGGIKFTAMPPAKRFRDMHLLSGGEKTLAAMALLFSVHAYQQPPFMVLDEVDAALDANNVQALANYVEQAHCQTIVISLKDRFFIKGEALVGVWKNKPQETSAILTLDLTRYPVGLQ